MIDATGDRGWRLNRSYESPGGRVAYDVIGSGPPVVLVHGTPFSSQNAAPGYMEAPWRLGEWPPA